MKRILTLFLLLFSLSPAFAQHKSVASQLRWHIRPPALVLTTTQLPNATQGVSYSAQLATSGGTGSVAYTISAETCQASVSPVGLVTWVAPPTVRTCTITFNIADSGSPQQVLTPTLSLTVVAASLPPLAITTTSLADGTVGTAYPVTILGATGGKAPYTWAVTAGSLPPGIVLNANGTISGTPTTAGDYTITFQTTDSE